MSRLEDVGRVKCLHHEGIHVRVCHVYGKGLRAYVGIVCRHRVSFVFPEKGGKDVVLDEINSYKDNPGELIFDDFEELIYTGYPIGTEYLG